MNKTPNPRLKMALLSRKLLSLGGLAASLALVALSTQAGTAHATTYLQWCLQQCEDSRQSCVAGCFDPGCVEDCNLWHRMCESSCF